MGSLLRESDICRFCAGHCDEKILVYRDTIPLQQSDTAAAGAADISYSAAASKYLQIKLDPSSPYPQYSCSDCRLSLQTVVLFYNKLEIGQSKLNEILVAEGSLQTKKRGRPRKGFEKRVSVINSPSSNDVTKEKRKVKVPKRFEDSGDVGKGKDNQKDSAVAASPNSQKEGTGTDQENLEDKKKSSGIYTCEACNKVFGYQDELATHIGECHGDIVYKCELKTCNAILKSQTELKDHQASCGHEDFIILEIGSGDKSTGSVSRDMKQEPDTPDLEGQPEPQVYKCEEEDCSRVFGSPSSLAYHKSSSHQQDTFPCTVPGCDKVFKVKNLLQRHLKTVHTSERLFNCDKCPKSFKTRSNLTTHSMVHNSESKFFCEECGQQFKHRSSLTAHIKQLHQGQKSFKCPFCPKMFSQKGNLQEHIRIHTGDRPFKCDLCPRTFTTSSQHRLHVKRHLGVKQFKCDVCTKSFLSKEALKTHLRRHKGEKPFACQVCKKAFAEAWALTKHMRFHTGATPYLCKECGKKFADSSNLAKHRKTHADQPGADKDKPTVWNIVREVGEEIQVAEVGVVEEAEQVIYITYEQEAADTDQDPATADTEAAGVKMVEVVAGEAGGAAGDQIKLTTKDGTQYRIVAPLDPITFDMEYIKDLQS